MVAASHPSPSHLYLQMEHSKKEMDIFILTYLSCSNDVMSLLSCVIVSPILLRLNACVQCVGCFQSTMCYDRSLTCDR